MADRSSRFRGLNRILFLLWAAFGFTLADAGGQTKRIQCYTCRDAQVMPCEDHQAAAEWCKKHGFFCSECIREQNCCRGRGMVPCRCAEHSFDNIDDPGYGHFQNMIDSQRSLVEAMKAQPLYAVTDHFLLISTMDGVKFSPGEVKEHQEEFDTLKKVFPWLFRNCQQLSPHAMLHLYLLRLERVHRVFYESLDVNLDGDGWVQHPGLIEVFLAGPVKHKDVWQSRHNGAALVSGSGGKYILAQKDVGGGARNRKFFGPSLSGDKNFYDGVIHLTGRCLIDRYFVAGRGKFPPGWLKVGFPHYLEWEMLGQCSYYLVNVEIKGLGESWIAQGWDKRIVAEARRSDCMSFALLSKKDFADLGYKEHLLSWGYVKYCVKETDRKMFKAYLDNLKSRMFPRDALMEAYEWSELTLEDHWRRSILGGASEDADLTKEERFQAEFDRTRANPDLETRASAAYYLKFCDNLEAAERILEAFQDREILVQASALAALRTFENEEAVRYVVEKGLTHASEEVRRYTAVAMGTFPDLAEISVPLLLKLLGDIKGPVRAGAVRALGELHPDEVYQDLAAMADDKDPEVRVELALALWNYKRDDALTKVIILLRDPVWAVRLAAVRAIHNIRDRRIIPPLIDQLGKEGGRLREDIHDLLVKHTSQDFGIDSARWNDWWERYGEAFVFRDPTKRRRTLPKYAMQYHEVETCSKKFIFLLDVSSSMKEMIDVEKIGGKTYSKGDLRKSKLEVAKIEIVRLLRTFDKNILFNLITFTDKEEVWKKKVAPASKGVVKAAEKYVWDLKIPEKSSTNIYDTLMEAFDMVDAGFEKRKYESVVDTMFLLSDGNPTAGTVTDPEMILRTVKERNRIHGIKIHTFSMGGRGNTEFLRKLADLTGGQFQVIRVR